MQKFSYHNHTSFQNIFDGHNTADEMITAYEKKGFTQIGISNHCICHPSVNTKMSPQFFNDVDKFLEICKASFDYIDEAASKHKIKVFKGLEVDYFPSAQWNRLFEKIVKEIKPDYMIGSTHFIRTADESEMYNLYYIDSFTNLSDEDKKEMAKIYWKNIELCIKSGYFNFIAHPDYCCQFNIATTSEWDDLKYKVIEALYSTKTACEINTKGITNIGRPFPDWWIIKELIKKEVPLLISDDAHDIKSVGRYFFEIEEKLKEFGCKKRFISL